MTATSLHPSLEAEIEAMQKAAGICLIAVADRLVPLCGNDSRVELSFAHKGSHVEMAVIEPIDPVLIAQINEAIDSELFLQEALRGKFEQGEPSASKGEALSAMFSTGREVLDYICASTLYEQHPAWVEQATHEAPLTGSLSMLIGLHGISVKLAIHPPLANTDTNDFGVTERPTFH